MTNNIADDNTPYKRLVTTAAASIPSAVAGGENLFIDSADNLVKKKNSAGTVAAVGGAASVNSFETIVVSGQSDVVADSATDTLTLVAGSGMTITTNAGTDTITLAAAGGLNDYIKVSDVKAANTEGGTFTSGAWRTRDINTEDSDTGGHCSVASNQITLAAGTYTCKIECPANYVDSHKAKLYNTTDAADVLIGVSSYSGKPGAATQSVSLICGKFTIATSKVFEVRHICQTTLATSGFGFAGNFGVSEVYTVAEFWKVA